MFRWLIIFLTFSSAAIGQQLIEGRIVDSETGKPVPFASIGIVGTSMGTSSNLNGQFSLSVPDSATLRVTCIGYKSLSIDSSSDLQLIKLEAIATQLDEIVVFNKTLNPRKIVKKAFANVGDNYSDKPFMQKFFYRHYCKDDSVYGRLIEASVDIWKPGAYASAQNPAGPKEQIRVTQLRRSLDKTVMAQGHEPISIVNILHADMIGYQSAEKSTHMSFYTDVSNLKTDFDNYTFSFRGGSTYDGEEVYAIDYAYKKDSVLTSSGRYNHLAEATGTLYITMNTYAFVKTEEIKSYGNNSIRTSAYYRKYNNRYYPYHLIRDGETNTSEKNAHAFHIELMLAEIRTDSKEKFTGSEPGKDQLLKIPYDSLFWSNNTILKATPLEDEIIRDLGGGTSLNKQFIRYQEYEMNTRDGGENGEEKFNWFKEDSKGKRILYLFFLASDCQSYFAELELAKRLNKQYRNEISFVLLSMEEDPAKWKQTMTNFNLSSDGMINYRISKNSDLLKTFDVKSTPYFVLIDRSGIVFDMNAKRPSNPLLEQDFKHLIGVQE